MNESRVNEVERRVNTLLQRVSDIERMGAMLMDKLNSISSAVNSGVNK